MEAKKAERLEKIIDNNFEYLDKYFTKYFRHTYNNHYFN